MPIHSSNSGGGDGVVGGGSSSSDAATAAGQNAPQRHLANRHELRVSGSDSYGLLFLFLSASMFPFAFFFSPPAAWLRTSCWSYARRRSYKVTSGHHGHLRGSEWRHSAWRCRRAVRHWQSRRTSVIGWGFAKYHSLPPAARSTSQVEHTTERPRSPSINRINSCIYA